MSSSALDKQASDSGSLDRHVPLVQDPAGQHLAEVVVGIAQNSPEPLRQGDTLVVGRGLGRVSLFLTDGDRPGEAVVLISSRGKDFRLTVGSENGPQFTTHQSLGQVGMSGGVRPSRRSTERLARRLAEGVRTGRVQVQHAA